MAARPHRVAAFTIALMLSAGAAAGVTATRTSGNGSAIVDGAPSGPWTVTITIPDIGYFEDHEWLIEADGNDVIEDITVISCPNHLVSLKPVYLTIQPMGTGQITEMGRVRSIGIPTVCSVPGVNVVIDYLEIAGDLSGDLLVQGVREAIIQGDVFGTIAAQLTADGESPDLLGINTIEIEGDLRGSILSAVGPIGSVEVTGDVIKATADILVSAPELGRLTAASFAGEIDISGQVGRILISDASGTPDLLGEVNIGSFASIDPTSAPAGLYIDGDLYADVTLTSALTHPIVIGGDLFSTATITLPSGGLQSLIRINNRDVAADWDGTISVGATDLTSATYAATASSLGGGSVGLVPYELHNTSCDPAEGSTIFITGIDIMDPEFECLDIPFTEAVLRSYGPVEFVGSPPYFTVQTHDGTAWQAASFTLNSTIVSGSDDLRISFKRPSDAPWPMGLHSIKPIEGKVVCKGVSATSDPDVAPWGYTIELADGCGPLLLSGFDLNNDSTLCAQDAAEWMNNPVDLNGDETVDASDLTRLLEAIDRYNSLD